MRRDTWIKRTTIRAMLAVAESRGKSVKEHFGEEPRKGAASKSWNDFDAAARL